MKTVVTVHRINWNMGYAPMPPIKKVQATHAASQGGDPPRERMSCDKLAEMSNGYEVRDRNVGDMSTRAKGKGWNNPFRY